jgi:hypothetical protein
VAFKALVWIQMLPADVVSHARQKFESFATESTFVSCKFGVLLKVLAEIIFFRNILPQFSHSNDLCDLVLLLVGRWNL